MSPVDTAAAENASPVSGHVVAVGPAAFDALDAAIDTAKAGDALATVTVVVPTNYVAVAVRRHLVQRRGALAAVTFLTAYRLAELVAAPTLAAAGRRPVSAPVITAAVRRTLMADPGVFAAVAGHPSTERALVNAYRELADVPDRFSSAVARQGPRPRDVVRIVTEARRRIAGEWYDESDLLAAATSSIASAAAVPVLAELGAVIVYLPQRMGESTSAMLRALAADHPVSVVAAATGVDDADAAVRESVRRLGVEWTPPDPVTPAADRVVSVSDPEEEVRLVVSEVVAAGSAGIRPDRMAILYGGDEPYARLLHEHLRGAQVAFNGSSLRTISEGVLGRAVLGLLGLADRDWRREDVMAVIGSGLMVDGSGAPVPAAAWERVSRAAGVVGGADWDTRLHRYGADLEDRIALLALEESAGGRRRGLQREAATARELRTTVADLAGRLDPDRLPDTWSGLTGVVRALIADHLGGIAGHDDWPPEERALADRLDGVLDRLAVLDGIDAAPTLDVFLRALTAEFDSGLGRVGRLGEGVFVGSLPLSWGVGFDHVWILGMAEGLMPSRPREDSLLPDRERAVAGGHLRSARERLDSEHRALLSVLAGATRAVLTHPRGDLRRTTDRRPSRWLLDAVSAREGRPVDAESMAHLGEPHHHHVASFVAGLRARTLPVSNQEYDLCRILAAVAQGGDVADDDVFSHPRLRRGVELVRARAGRFFTRFDGNLAGCDVPSPTDPGVVMSPTRLEAWAKCPHHYFIRHLLRVEPVELPERELKISPLELGSLVHGVLDRWLAEMIGAPGGPPRPGVAWSPAQRSRLHEILDEECDLAEARGVVGRALFWEVHRRRLHREMEEFCGHDDDQRAARGSVPVSTEVHFGFGDGPVPPVTYGLADGRSLRLRGSADRVDAVGDGYLVIDYKTGSSRRFAKLGPEDPHGNGTRLQLPVYAAAVREIFDAPDAEVTAAYWFVSSSEKWAWRELILDEAVGASVDEVLVTIADGIASGVFVARAEAPGFGSWVECASCSPDGLTTADRARELERKAADPALAAWLALAVPDLVPGGGA
ncbi:MAG: PD-(D/E)XK nuclease family protein [Acidimicrobiales bacterium]